MDLLKSASNKKRVIAEGEGRLHEKFNMTQAKGKTVEVVMGLDVGSTQGRVTIVDQSDLQNLVEQLNKTTVIPSISATVLDDRVIAPRSELMYDMMDTFITNLSGNLEAPFQAVRLVRGAKAQDVETKENRLTSSTQKIYDTTFYYNLFDMAGYGIVDKFEGSIPETVNAVMSIALPPDDKNEKNIERLEHNLASFNWKHRETGVTIKFNITRVVVHTEPEAFIKAYYALTGKEVPETTLHIEGGGRSTGAEVLVNGESLGTAQKSMDFGGTQLKDMIGSSYVAKNGGRVPKEALLDAALETGLLKVGNGTVDIVELIIENKDVMALKIADEVGLKIFDQQSKVTYADLNVISVSGRLMKPGQYEYSLAKPLADRFKELAPNTEFLYIEGNYIPQGLVLLALMKMMEEAEKQAQEQVAPSLDSTEDEAQKEVHVTMEE